MLSTAATTHGTLYPYDQRVPVIFFGAGVARGVHDGAGDSRRHRADAGGARRRRVQPPPMASMLRATASRAPNRMVRFTACPTVAASVQMLAVAGAAAVCAPAARRTRSSRPAASIDPRRDSGASRTAGAGRARRPDAARRRSAGAQPRRPTSWCRADASSAPISIIRGVRVFGADVARQFAGGQVVSMFGTLYDDIVVDTTPSVAERGAAAASKSRAGVRLGPSARR